MHYYKQKRNVEDYCNICGKRTKLSWDHVPPKCILNNPDTIVNTVFSEVPRPNRCMSRFQSGIKYRTICQSCNGIVGKYDVALKEFIKGVSNELKLREKCILDGMVLPRSFSVSLRINQVLKSLAGHFLAMKSEYDNESMCDKYFREFIANKSLVLSKEYHIYTWFYPHSTVVNARDFVVKGYSDHFFPSGIVSVMAIYPLAFMVSTSDESDTWLDDIGKYSTSIIDDVIMIKLSLDTVFYAKTNKPKHFKWPLYIADDDYGAMMIMGNKEIMNESKFGMPNT